MPVSCCRTAAVAIVAALVPFSIFAQPAPAAPAATASDRGIDPALLAGLRWRSIGPTRGGRVTTVTGVPSEPFTFYLGGVGGGVWKTEDAGTTWRNLTDAFLTEGSVGAVEVAPSDPHVVYVGTGSDAIRSNVSTGRGVYRSGDAGRTWTFVGLRGVGQIGGVRVDPRDANVAYVAAIGNAFRADSARGLYKTVDGGRTWQRALFVSDSTGAVDVELQPGSPDVVYASMWRAERKPWTIISGAREGGVYKSTDAGRTWRKLAGGLPNGLFGKSNLAVTAADPRRVYALVEAKPGSGLYRSDDAGESWRLVNTQPGLLTRPFYYTTLAADPTNADIVYAGAEDFFRSADGGRTFAPMATPHGDNHDLWANPRDGRVLIQSNDGGANVSLTGGRSWSTQLNQPTAEIYNVAVDDQVPYRVYGAQQDEGGTLIVPSLPTEAAGLDDPVQAWHHGPGCETGPVLPQPASPDTVWGACKGQFSRMALRTGQERQYWIGAQSLYGEPNAALRYRFQRVSPMATSPHDPRVVYYGSQFVHKSSDGGVTWTVISPDLTANDPRYRQTISGGPITVDATGEEMYATLYSIRESPVARGVIWAGANDGPVHVTRDGGRTWSDVTPPALPPGGRVQTVEPSPHRAGGAYVAVLRYQLGDFRPYLYATNDYGRTWRLLTPGTNGIPADEPTRVVREDLARPGLLYAGTEFGVYVSADDGGHWQPLPRSRVSRTSGDSVDAGSGGMPAVPVTDLVVHRSGDLVASTQGRGFWILDDLTPLRAVADARTRAALDTAPALLVAPRPAVRLRYRAAFGGEESERASSTDPQYPPPGAALDYWLGSATRGMVVSLTLLDSAGRTVREFATAARGGALPLDGSPGAHRVVWDLATAGPLDPADARRSGRGGPMVPPGRYSVRLALRTATSEAVRWSATRPLVIDVDPRSRRDGITPAVLAAQFAHNVRARDLVSDAQTLARDVAAGVTRAASDSTAPDAAARLARLRALQATLTGERFRYGRPGLLAEVRYLYGMTTQADQPVGRDAAARYDALRQAVGDRRREADALLGASARSAAAR
ncbi:MAG TPA: hypothetical protein VGD56_21995 [Gemmatirosa sp.]